MPHQQTVQGQIVLLFFNGGGQWADAQAPIARYITEGLAGLAGLASGIWQAGRVGGGWFRQELLLS